LKRSHLNLFLFGWLFVYRTVLYILVPIRSQAVSINRVDTLPRQVRHAGPPFNLPLNQELDGGDDDALYEPRVGNEGLTDA
jgi:hypothetical protein